MCHCTVLRTKHLNQSAKRMHPHTNKFHTTILKTAGYAFPIITKIVLWAMAILSLKVHAKKLMLHYDTSPWTELIIIKNPRNWDIWSTQL